MIAMVEARRCKRTPNEIALEILLIAFTMIFVLVTMSLYASPASWRMGRGRQTRSPSRRWRLLVCLAPTTIGALLSAIGIAGMKTA
ncbi:MAG: hypothetical protein ACLUEQ_00920 [Cloacibacillus evryensis]